MRCIVVGASGMLGRAVCLELAKRGARVGGTFLLNEDAAGEIGRSVDGFVARRLDLADAASIERVIGEIAAALGGADALVHCAGISSAAKEPKYDRLADVDPARLGHLLTVNVAGPLLVARAFAAHGQGAPPADTPETRLRTLRASRSASVGADSKNLVLVGSIDGAKPVPTATPYATTKGALVAMARALAKELGPRILVNVVAPGVLENGITAVVPDDVKREYLKHCSMKRFGTHAEIARSIAWLALENTYVTGQTLIADGGL
jgi:NAD(P)-dependent dehydrogenase (short-subunit alcohol dehydrogenase family)